MYLVNIMDFSFVVFLCVLKRFGMFACMQACSLFKCELKNVSHALFDPNSQFLIQSVHNQ